MNWALFFAFLAPAIFGFMNVFDTFIIKRRVKHILGFAVVAAIGNIILGLILALFLDWSIYSFSNYWTSIIAGLVLGIQQYFYYFALSKHDVSHAIGFIYIYPIIVAILSFAFLNEQLSFIGYSGMIIALAGVLLMSVQINRLKIGFAIWSLAVVALTSALNEFFIKIATSQVGEWHGAAINSVVMGLFLLPLLLRKKVRKGFGQEIKNINLIVVSEALTIGAIAMLYLAMAGLPATIVSVISVTQPLFVLLFEFLAFSFGIKIVKDEGWWSKMLGILLIVIGIAILYASEIA